ncbi:hypothetical protein Tsubulata_021863 [Turnera subulata]|uniref:RRM domain-containing protein n=1 Tax=Turnera subulata TaxID=218843 RepID=A0A9Q0JC91_9ROSI|nr:hypothetical protein Tsubulata_021863 [Turnera subulata]
MEENSRIEDEDREALEGMSQVPPPNRKIYSYSQQLRVPSSGHKKHNKHRKHSLDDIPKTGLPPNAGSGSGGYPESFDSSDEEFLPNSEAYLISNSGHHQYDGEDDIRHSQPLPEFMSTNNSNNPSIFKCPGRFAIHPARPPYLELRPHPLRETQVGKFLRTIACTDTQLWAGQENGIRFWRFENSYLPGCGIGGRVTRGDEDAAPFQSSVNTSPAFCLTIDSANRLVWSGHKDGKVRSWKMDQPADDDTPFKEGLSWQAHKGAITSIIISSCGDLWSGGEGGVLKIWPWETMEKSLSLKSEEKRMAALLVERSHIDLRSQVTVNGNCRLSSSEVKCMLSDCIRAKVWCAQPMFFSLWDARTKELIKVFNIEGIEHRLDLPSGQQQEQAAEGDMKTKLVSTTKKEKSGFLQRSRNAIIGAADAVRRVATRGATAFGDDSGKKTEALVLTLDGMIWSGCTTGLLIQWDGNGNRLQDFTHHSYAVQCFCTFGTQLYVGYSSGFIQILDLDGNLLAIWVAHSNPVLKMAVGDNNIYSLASHGGIRGWHITSPGPLDSIIRTEIAEKEVDYTRRDSFRILVGTWNVGQGRASQDAIKAWLGSVSSDVGIIVVGCQEVEMGAGFLAMSAAKETVGLEGSSIGQWWLDNIGKGIGEGTAFERMGSRQLAGLLISLWVRKELRTDVGDVDAAAVACGFGRAIGNKGGVGLRIRVYDRIMCFVNCHLAAHLEAVNRRNADFDHIYRTMAFGRSSTLGPAAGVSSTTQATKGSNAPSIHSDDLKPDLAEADMVVFLGDFNYRLFGISYDEARDFVSQRSFDWLRERDQLRAEMKAGRVFQGMREALITFPPTYKFARNQPGLGGYDSGEKKRIPAWCDRIIYRDSRSASESECGLECPVLASVYQYEACMEVIESDHKPVRCKFHVQVAHVDRSVRRQELGEVIKTNEKIQSMLKDSIYVPETTVSVNEIVLQNQDTSTMKITNTCMKDKAVFIIKCEGQSVVKEDGEEADYRPRGGYGFPRWLEIMPVAGIIKPGQSVDVSVHHEEFQNLEENVDGIPQNWWSEDTRDKEVILVVNVQGTTSTEERTHRIKVRHCFSAKTARLDSNKSNSSGRRSVGGGSIQNRSEQKQRGSSPDAAADGGRQGHAADSSKNDGGGKHGQAADGSKNDGGKHGRGADGSKNDGGKHGDGSKNDGSRQSEGKRLSSYITKNELRNLFSPFGVVTEARLVVDPETKKPKGFGFVTFESEINAQKALKTMNGRIVNGRLIFVEVAKTTRHGEDGRS